MDGVTFPAAIGLREPTGPIFTLLATTGDARDFDPEFRPPARGDPEPVLLPVPVLVPVFVVPVPDVDVDERCLEVAFDSSNLTSLPTTKLFVVTKLTIHSGISPLLVFCFSFVASSGDVFPGERLLGLDWSVCAERGVGVPGLKN